MFKGFGYIFFTGTSRDTGWRSDGSVPLVQVVVKNLKVRQGHRKIAHPHLVEYMPLAVIQQLVKPSLSLRWPVQLFQGQPQIVIRLGIIGVGVSPGAAFQSLAEIPLRPFKLSPAKQQGAAGVVQPDIPRVPLPPLQVVGIGAEGGVAVLLQVEPGEVQRLAGHDVLRGLCRLGGLGQLGDLLLQRGIGHQFPCSVQHFQGQLSLVLHRAGHHLLIGLHRRKYRLLIQQHPAAISEQNPGMGIFPAGISRHSHALRSGFQVHHRVDGGVLHRPHRLIGHEVLGKGLFLKGLEPGEVGLVVGEHPGHQLHVGAVLVGEAAVPGPAEVAAAPGPLLFARRDVVVGHVEDARAPAVVVAAHKVEIAPLRHVGGGHGDILVPGDVHPGAVIVLVVHPRGDGEPGHVPFAVVHHRVDVRRKDGLGVLVHRDGGVGPPQEGLGLAGAAVAPPLRKIALFY